MEVKKIKQSDILHTAYEVGKAMLRKGTSGKGYEEWQTQTRNYLAESFGENDDILFKWDAVDVPERLKKQLGVIEAAQALLEALPPEAIEPSSAGRLKRFSQAGAAIAIILAVIALLASIFSSCL